MDAKVYKFGILAAVIFPLLAGCGFKSSYYNGSVNDGVPQIVSHLGKGNYVALAYSRAGNTVFLGRSQVSSDLALSNAVQDCKYSDCKEFYVAEHDGCVAFAKNTTGRMRWGKARAVTADEATRIALRYCNVELSQDTCVHIVTFCPEQ